MQTSFLLVCPHCGKTNRLPADRTGAGAMCGACAKPLFSARPLDVSAAMVDKQVAHNDIPVLVDVRAPWCGPCRMMAPAYEKAAAALEPRVRLLKLNTDDHPSFSSHHAIRGIPTMLLFYGAARSRVRPALQTPTTSSRGRKGALTVSRGTLMRFNDRPAINF